MGVAVWIWMGGNSFLGAFEGVGPKISTFLGLNGSRYAHYLVMDYSPHPNPYVPPHINNRYIYRYSGRKLGGIPKQSASRQHNGDYVT